MASDVLCGRCGTLLRDPMAPCPRCGAPASGRWQQAYARTAPKDPWKAALLAIIPGCGHFYLGHNLKGLALLLGISGFQLLDFGFDVTGIGAFVGIPLELGPAGLWLYSIVDAYRTAQATHSARYYS